MFIEYMLIIVLSRYKLVHIYTSINSVFEKRQVQQYSRIARRAESH